MPRKKEALFHPKKSLRRFFYFFLLVLLSLPFPLVPRKLELRFQHFGVSDGLSENRVFVITQDNLGFLWIGTYDGLNRYDGYSFVPYRHQPGNANSISNKFIYDLHFNPHSGRLWILTFYGLDSLLPATDRITRYTAPSAILQGAGNTMVETRAGEFWIGTLNGELICLDGASALGMPRPVPLQFLSGFDRKYRINKICEDAHGDIWIATDNGLFRYVPGDGGVVRIQEGPVKYFCFDDRGLAWIIGAASLDCLDPASGSRRRYPPLKDMEKLQVNSSIADRCGWLWIATTRGLRLFDCNVGQYLDLVRTRSDPTSPINERVTSLFEDTVGNIWLGTRGGGLFKFNRRVNQFSYIGYNADPHFGLRSPFVRSILEDRAGIIWIGTYLDGLYRYDPQSLEFANYGGIPFPLRPSASVTIDSLLEDSAGSLWIGTNDKLRRFDPRSGNYSCFSAEPKKPGSISGNHTAGMIEDRNGNLWISTDHGLNLMDRQHGSFRAYSTEHGLCERYIRDVIEDNNGFLWVSHNQGISRFDSRHSAFRNFGKSDGVTIDGGYSLAKCRNGKILVGGFQGAVIFDPQAVATVNTHVPPVIITTLCIGNRSVPLPEVFSQSDQVKKPGRVVLRPRDKVLAVEFSALDFSAPEKNRYAFRMDEQRGGWNDLGTQHQITFSNLGVGEHILRVKGSNNDGIWNETGVALQIIVLPAFWQTWWFKLLVLLFLGAFALAIYALCRTIASLKRISTPPNLEEIFAKHNISHREQEILHLVIQGKSNREMENELFISLPTVKRHLANIYEKIGVSSRLQLINFLQGRKPRY